APGLDLAVVAENPVDVRLRQEPVPAQRRVREVVEVDVRVDERRPHHSAPGKKPRCAPPSTSSATPVRKLASSETKNNTASATSASVALRPSGFVRAVAAMISSAVALARRIFQSSTFCPIPVVGQPTGQTTFAVTWSWASSTAIDSIRPISPNFDAV